MQLNYPITQYDSTVHLEENIDQKPPFITAVLYQFPLFELS